MSTYYRTVKASERPVNKGWYNAINGTDKVPCTIFFDGKIWRNEEGHPIKLIQLYHYLEPISFDVDKMREALGEIQKVIVDGTDKSVPALRLLTRIDIMVMKALSADGTIKT